MIFALASMNTDGESPSILHPGLLIFGPFIHKWMNVSFGHLVITYYFNNTACRWKGESLQESIKRHEHFLALQLGLKPGQKVWLAYIIINKKEDIMKYLPYTAAPNYLLKPRL